MLLLEEYLEAQRVEKIARVCRVLAVRALAAAGVGAEQIAQRLGIDESTVAEKPSDGFELAQLHTELLVNAAGPVLKALAQEQGYTNLAVFGSVARGQAHGDSDIDLIVESPQGTSSFDFVRFKLLIEQVLGREVDLIDYGGLTPTLDDDIRRDVGAVDAVGQTK